MKKYLSMLMAVLMLMGMLTINAGAIDEVHNVSYEDAMKYIDLWVVDKNGKDAEASSKAEDPMLVSHNPYTGGALAHRYNVNVVRVNPEAQLLFKNLGGKYKSFISIDGYKAVKTTLNKELSSGSIIEEYSGLDEITDKNQEIYVYDEMGYRVDNPGKWISYGDTESETPNWYLTNGKSLKIGFPGGNDGDLYIINVMISFDEVYSYEAAYWQTYYIKLDSSVPLLSGDKIVDGGKFTDVHSSDYFFKPIYWAVENGITNGTSDTTFSPQVTCTNAHIITFLWRAYGSKEPTINNPFTDIKETDYFYKAALWAAQNGLISGKEFKSNSPCTRGSTVKFMWTLAGKPTGNSVNFSDVPSNSDIYNAVAWAYKVGVTSGTTENTFSPDSTCTRGQIVTFLYRGLANK